MRNREAARRSTYKCTPLKRKCTPSDLELHPLKIVSIKVRVLCQNEKQVARPAFCFGKTKRGIRTRREQTKSAEENSPMDCFRRRGQGAERREGAQACAEKPLALRHKSTVVFIELRCFLLLSKDLSNDIINYNMLNFFLGGGYYTFQIQANAKRRCFRIHKRNV